MNKTSRGREEKKRTYRKIEVVGSNIGARIRGLYDHLLATDRSRGEGELIALAACRIASGHSGEAISEVIRYSPW